MGVFLGVDVGTGSVRAALFSTDGQRLAMEVEKISLWKPQPNLYQQDSEEIWKSCCSCVQRLMSGRGPDHEPVLGVGFDATCSLVVLDEGFAQLTVSPHGEPNQNVVAWMDHRAVAEAELITGLQHEVLHNVGGTISPEMQTPKLLWLKRHLGSTWERAAHFFDLPDFLTWKATGSLARSLCTLVCKWTYQADGAHAGWNKSYFEQIGLGELAEDGWKRIGRQVVPPGSPLGEGLSVETASQLGLLPGTRVGAAMIDAHAGGLGLMACDSAAADPCTRLGIICGTSSCFMAVSQQPCPTPGLWGPYWGAMLPDLWLTEAGQSASGKLLEFVLESHPAGSAARPTDRCVQAEMEQALEDKAGHMGLADVALLAADLHVYPDHHGNRSPYADPTLRGMYGSRCIVDAMKSGGHQISAVYICGGITNSPLFVKTLADVLGVPVTCPNRPEAVLLGSAMLGAVAGGLDLARVRQLMGGSGRRVVPQPHIARFHAAKYNVFKRMRLDQLAYRDLMRDATNPCLG